jgi:ABC-type branched-subunit amino acid transport system permease subunit
VISVLWYVVLGLFIVSMLTWIPRDWESVLNQGLAFSTLFLSITLITGMGGQLSLAQAGLAGVGAFTAAQLANHLGLPMMAGMVVGAAFAAAVAVLLAVLSLRLRGLGLALMTLGAALVFDNIIQSSQTLGGGSGGLGPMNNVDWGSPFGLLNPNGHALFLATFSVLVVVTLAILMIRRGTVGRLLGAMRGSETAAAGIGINLTWQRILIFALSGAVAGIGGTLLVIQQGVANPQQFNYVFSLAFVVIVVTTGGGDSGGLRVCHHPEAPRVRTGAVRQPDVRAVRLRGTDVRPAPRGHPRIPEATFDATIRAVVRAPVSRIATRRRLTGRTINCRGPERRGRSWLSKDPSWRSAEWQRPSGGSTRSRTSRSTCRRARASGSSDPTAPARRRSSTASAGS